MADESAALVEVIENAKRWRDHQGGHDEETTSAAVLRFRSWLFPGSGGSFAAILDPYPADPLDRPTAWFSDLSPVGRGGGSEGLGYYIAYNAGMLNTSKMYVGILLFGVFGIVMGEVIRVVEHHFDAWRPELG